MHEIRPALGASGAIAGVIGAYAATFRRAKIWILILIFVDWAGLHRTDFAHSAPWSPKFPIPVFFCKLPVLGYAMAWFGYQLLQGFISPAYLANGDGIAWWAHIGGFVAGFVLVPLWRWGPDRTYDEEQYRQHVA